MALLKKGRTCYLLSLSQAALCFCSNIHSPCQWPASSLRLETGGLRFFVLVVAQIFLNENTALYPVICAPVRLQLYTLAQITILVRSISLLFLIFEILQSFGDIQPADAHLLSPRIQASSRLVCTFKHYSPSVKHLCDAKTKVAATTRIRGISEGSIRGT
jgi:hypothetical protein